MPLKVLRQKEKLKLMNKYLFTIYVGNNEKVMANIFQSHHLYFPDLKTDIGLLTEYLAEDHFMYPCEEFVEVDRLNVT